MAKNFNHSDYALNKNSKGIVYRNADGSRLEITFEKVSATDPTFTQEDFDKLKSFSDEVYHQQENADNRQSYYVKATLNEEISSDWIATPTLEEELLQKADAPKNAVKKIYTAINTLLTETQRRRLILHAFKGLTTREIAKIEGTNNKSVHESIVAAQRKIKKFLTNF